MTTVSRQSERSHFVFLKRCGCPIGLVEKGRFCVDEDEAWDSMYDTRAGERAARERGISAVHVSHAEYTATYYTRMTAPCPHGGSDA